jgi:hypothetical protein
MIVMAVQVLATRLGCVTGIGEYRFSSFFGHSYMKKPSKRIQIWPLTVVLFYTIDQNTHV